MKVLLTGADGQLGRAMRAAAPSGVEVNALGSALLDITDRNAVQRVVDSVRPDVIVNAAAFTAVDRAEQESERALDVNAHGVAHLAEAASAHGARLVQISTDFVFDGAASRPYRPRDPTGPLGVYGNSKLLGEAAAGSDALVVRTAWVYASQGSNFVLTMLRLMQERASISVVADQFGTPTWASSLADAVWWLTTGGTVGVHHFTDSGCASWYDFAVAIQEEAVALGLLDSTAEIVPIATADYPTAARRPPFSVLDKTETFRLLGAPAPHWRKNLRSMLKELHSNG